METALSEMLNKIEDLAAVSEDQSKDKLIQVAKHELRQEEELHDTLKELQEVAKEIELVASSSSDGKSNTETIEKMAQALQAASEKIRGVEESFEKDKEDEEENANLVEEKKTNEDTSDKALAGEDKDKEDNKEDNKEDDISIKKDTVKKDNVKEGRKGKAVEGDIDYDNEDEDKEEVDKAEAERKGKADDGGASVEVAEAVTTTTPEPPKETCEEKTANNKVQVGLPPKAMELYILYIYVCTVLVFQFFISFHLCYFQKGNIFYLPITATQLYEQCKLCTFNMHRNCSNKIASVFTRT